MNFNKTKNKPVKQTLFIILIISISTITIINSFSIEKKDDFFIVTTTGMIADSVKNIGGSKVRVKALMGPGVDPHLYTAKAKDLVDIYNADLIFFNGLHLEAAMSKVLAGIQNKLVYQIGLAIPEESLIYHDNFIAYPDPHIWFDVTNWISISYYIYEKIVLFDPDNSNFYLGNFQNYIQKLTSLHEYVLNKSSELSTNQKFLVTAHDAFSYFGRAYNFTVIGLQGISTATQAGTSDVSNLANFIVKNRIKSIFVETSVNHQSIEAVKSNCESQGWTVSIGGNLYSDAMGDEGTFEGTYQGMITHNIDTIVNSLK
jgi:manganese/zinc/iron transport system substrate-binding protein